MASTLKFLTIFICVAFTSNLLFSASAGNFDGKYIGDIKCGKKGQFDGFAGGPFKKLKRGYTGQGTVVIKGDKVDSAIFFKKGDGDMELNDISSKVDSSGNISYKGEFGDTSHCGCTADIRGKIQGNKINVWDRGAFKTICTGVLSKQ